MEWKFWIEGAISKKREKKTRKKERFMLKYARGEIFKCRKISVIKINLLQLPGVRSNLSFQIYVHKDCFRESFITFFASWTIYHQQLVCAHLKKRRICCLSSSGDTCRLFRWLSSQLSTSSVRRMKCSFDGVSESNLNFLKTSPCAHPGQGPTWPLSRVWIATNFPLGPLPHACVANFSHCST